MNKFEQVCSDDHHIHMSVGVGLMSGIQGEGGEKVGREEGGEVGGRSQYIIGKGHMGTPPRTE